MTSPNPSNSSGNPSANPSTGPSIPELMPVGRIVSPQGLDGELRVYPESEFPERFVVPGDRWLLRPKASQPERVELLAGRFLPKKNLYVIRLKGVNYRDQAEDLRQAQLLVPVGDRPPLEDGEFHALDLIGLTVIDQTTGNPIGTVVEVLAAGNDLLEVALGDGESPTEQTEAQTNEQAGQPVGQKASQKDKRPKLLIPFVHEIVPVVDLKAQRIEIVPPPGLLDLQTTPREKKPKNRPRGKQKKQRRPAQGNAAPDNAAPDNAAAKA